MNSAVAKHPVGPMTGAEFLAWERRQPVKYEFNGQYPVSWGYDTIVPEAMVGASLFHAAIQSKLNAALNLRWAGKPCQPYGSDIKVQVNGKYRYPDQLVLCRPPKLDELIIGDPTLVFEILSDASWHRDMFVKSQ